MTNEEAIQYNKNLREYMRITDKKSEYKFLEENYIALDMAIKALEQQPCDSNISDPCDGCRYELSSTNGNPCYSCGKYKLTEQQPCGDAISRQAVLTYIDKMPSELTADGRRMIRRRTLEEYISDTLPSVTPQQKIGHWIEVAKYSDGKHEIECSECGSHIFDRGHANSYVVKEKYKYCPRCAAKMQEVKK